MSLRLAETLEALSEARAYMIRSKRWVGEQSAIIEELEDAGADTLDAILYLETLEKMHADNVEYLMRLERKVLFCLARKIRNVALWHMVVLAIGRRRRPLVMSAIGP